MMSVTNKRLLGILLCLVLALVILPLTVFEEEEAKRLYLKPASNWMNKNARFAAYFYGDPGEEWRDCTDEDGDGIYEVTVPSGFGSVIFCRMDGEEPDNDWSNRWNQTMDLKIPADGTDCYVVPEGSWNQGVGTWIRHSSGSGKEEIGNYHLVGGMNGWTVSDGYRLTANGDGTHSVTVPLDAGVYGYKIVDAEETWHAESDVLILTVTTACDVTFRLDRGVVSASGDGLGEDTGLRYHVAGSPGLCGLAWDPAANPMSPDRDGRYSLTLHDIPAGTYAFKITTGSWDTPSYGDADGSNMTLTVSEPSDVTISFGHLTGEIGVTVQPVESTVTDEVKWQLNADASLDSASVDLRLISWVDSLDYSSIAFRVTINGQTVEIPCNTVYTMINVGDSVIGDASMLFGPSARYFVTYTITDLPSGHFSSDILVSTVREASDGTVTVSELRAIDIDGALRPH